MPGVHHGETGGYLAWQGQIAIPGRDGRNKFDDVFGAGALIVSSATNLLDLGPDLIERLAAAGIAVTSFDLETTHADVRVFSDVAGTYEEWFSQLEAEAVLVRPDFYVFGSASGDHAARDLAAGFLADIAAALEARAAI